MRRALDRAAVESIGANKSPHKQRKTVSFQEETLDDAAFKKRSPPRRRKDLPLLEQKTSPRSAEEIARENLSRLVANHRQLADSCSWTVLCDCRSSISRVVQYCLPDAPNSRYAAIVGDVMFIGGQPGIVDDAFMLTGADVSVDGAVVVISREGMSTISQRLNSIKEAEKWATKVQAAADLWSDCQQLTQAALQTYNRREAHRREAGKEKANRADTGGTFTPPFPRNCPNSVASRDQTHQPWVPMTMQTGNREPPPEDGGHSNWRWMLSLFGRQSALAA